jgi:hypothetical protein
MSFSWHTVLMMLSAGCGGAAVVFPPLAVPFGIAGAAVGAIAAGMSHNAGKAAIVNAAIVATAKQTIATLPAAHVAAPIVQAILDAEQNPEPQV